jgi:hypothetical protein
MHVQYQRVRTNSVGLVETDLDLRFLITPLVSSNICFRSTLSLVVTVELQKLLNVTVRG